MSESKEYNLSKAVNELSKVLELEDKALAKLHTFNMRFANFLAEEDPSFQLYIAVLETLQEVAAMRSQSFVLEKKTYELLRQHQHMFELRSQEETDDE